MRMARSNAVIRKLPAVETLGSATVICTDKTGTLTKNEMTVKSGYTPETLFSVTGEGYIPRGEFLVRESKIEISEYPFIEALFTALVLCNDSRLHLEEGAWKIVGDPTEGSLVVAGEKLGLKKHDLEAIQPRIDEIPFDSIARYMATLHKLPDGRTVVYVKGAPEKILSMCDRFITPEGVRPLDSNMQAAFIARNEEMAKGALRVLAAAYLELPHDANRVEETDIASKLMYLGAVGMMDPPREEARAAVQDTKVAGIRVIMVTGDHPNTARTIAESLGLLDEGSEVIEGRDIDVMSDDQLAQAIRNVVVIARAEPEHKIRIVKALRNDGQIVAMTGDGVNDAPALKMADIGVAMGITGTDVAKEAADMVLLDDNFATIVAAIEEGRNIFANIRRVVLYLLATNTGEILVYLAAVIASLPLPLLPVQILWINLITDGFSTVPLSLEPKEPGILSTPPRNPRTPVVTRQMWHRIAFVAVFMLVGTLGLFVWGLEHVSVERARTYAFVTIALFQVFNVLNVRSSKLSAFSQGLMSNPYLLLGITGSVLAQVAAVHLGVFQSALDTVPLSANEWLICTLVGSTVWIAEEIRKAVAPKLFHNEENHITA